MLFADDVDVKEASRTKEVILLQGSIIMSYWMWAGALGYQDVHV